MGRAREAPQFKCCFPLRCQDPQSLYSWESWRLLNTRVGRLQPVDLTEQPILVHEGLAPKEQNLVRRKHSILTRGKSHSIDFSFGASLPSIRKGRAESIRYVLASKRFLFQSIRLAGLRFEYQMKKGQHPIRNVLPILGRRWVQITDDQPIHGESNPFPTLTGE